MSIGAPSRGWLDFLTLVGGVLTIVALSVIALLAPLEGWLGVVSGAVVLVVAFSVRLPRSARVLGWLTGLFGLATLVLSIRHIAT
ncbi:hypothetical protein [Nocardioides sp.]|uniref:hypothetical protein n=1 Tax=Nocardioides sp. TaxID=35761 RepID=UPI003561AF2C